MKWTKLALIAFLAVSVLTACSKDKEQQTQPVQQEENKQEEIVDVAATEVAQEEKSDNSFPVPITFENKKEKLEELPEATQAAIQWTYDYFNTEGIETEEEFYQMMKEKHLQNVQINEDVDFIEGQITGYGSEMLPKFIPGQEMEIEYFEVWPEVPVGLTIQVPMYLKFKDKENMHAIAISYNTNEKYVFGASTDFPMILD